MRSVRARVTLVGVLVVVVTLAAAGLLLRLVVERQLTADSDDLSIARAKELATRAESLPPLLPELEDGVIQVVSHDADVMSATPNVAGRGPIATFRPQGDQPAVRTVRAPDDDETETYRLWAVRTSGYTVYVGRSVEPVEEAVQTLTTGLVVALPPLALLLAMALWVLVGRMLARLDETARREHEFVGNASHELLGPVATLRTQLEVAMAHPRDVAWPALAGDLLEDTLAMERLVKDLLYLARADADELALRRERVDLGELVRDVATAVSVEGRGVTVTGDREALARLVRNLVDNGLRHARRQVLVTLPADGLVVSDDGPGVAPENRERVFDRFFQADPARTRQVAGAGLGLAIARAIAERHGGTLTLAATGRLGGADFVLRLPQDIR